jgi:F-type H+-transporting ATPase subunit epsilon
MSLKIRVITPDKIVWNTPAEEVILPSTTGQLGILSSHAPLITALEIGVLRVKLEDSWKPMVLLGGFAEVENDEITILVNGVEEVAAGDLAAAKSALKQHLRH